MNVPLLKELEAWCGHCHSRDLINISLIIQLLGKPGFSRGRYHRFFDKTGQERYLDQIRPRRPQTPGIQVNDI